MIINELQSIVDRLEPVMSAMHQTIKDQAREISERLEPVINAMHQTIKDQAQEITDLKAKTKRDPRSPGQPRSSYRIAMEDMQAGETIFIPALSRKAVAKGVTGIQTYDRTHKHPLRRYTTRAVIEAGIEGVRIWRLE